MDALYGTPRPSDQRQIIVKFQNQFFTQKDIDQIECLIEKEKKPSPQLYQLDDTEQDRTLASLYE